MTADHIPTVPHDDPAALRAWLGTVTLRVREEVLQRWNADSCIASTRVLLATLARFGIEGRPTPTRVSVFNQTGWQMAQERIPVGQWPPTAWSVGVDGVGKSKSDRWNGHLVAVLKGVAARRVLIDPSGDQFARPECGIAAKLVVADLPSLWTPRDPLVLEAETADAATYVYAPLVNAHQWRDARDWQANTDAVDDAVEGAVARIEAA